MASEAIYKITNRRLTSFSGKKKRKSETLLSLSRPSLLPREVRSESNVNRTGVASTPTPRCLSTDFALWRTFAAESSSASSSSRCWTYISSLSLDSFEEKKSVDAFCGKKFFFRKKSKQQTNNVAVSTPIGVPEAHGGVLFFFFSGKEQLCSERRRCFEPRRAIGDVRDG